MKPQKMFPATVGLMILLSISTAHLNAQDVAVYIGNPTLARWPATGYDGVLFGDPHARRRSVWDMEYFNNRIYLGSGDYWVNSGTTDLWTYDGKVFFNEYAIDDQMVYDFFVFDQKLFIPGNDATEDNSFGNLYINDPDRIPNPGWIKYRNLPGCLHSMCLALYKNDLYAGMSTDGSTPNRILVSKNMGETWTTFLEELGNFLVVDDFLFINAGGAYTGNYYQFDGTYLNKVTPELFPDWNGSKSMGRFIKFRDGMVYSPVLRYMLRTAPLFFITGTQITNNQTATKVPQFAADMVRDIVVKDKTCYVMTAEEIIQDTVYRGRIYSTHDMVTWKTMSEFNLPGLPVSFEIMNNKFYVGLGGRYDMTMGWDLLIGHQSGSIWEIESKSLSSDQAASDFSSTYRVNQNYPNPCNLTTEIAFNLPVPSFVTMRIFNHAGQPVECLIQEDLPVGQHTRTWNSSQMPEGIYYCRFTAGSYSQTKKLVIIR